MFKLLYLKLNGHPQLGNLELRFVEDLEVTNSEKPYTTVIIGPNGTGKSFILRTIADIFRQFKEFQDSEKKDFRLPFTFHLRYKYDNDTYEIVTQRKTGLAKLVARKEYLFFKNRPWKTDSTESKIEATSAFEMPLKDLVFPDNIIVSSILLNDRFIFIDSKPDDFYQYMGVRRTRSVTSTSTFPKKTVRYLFDSSSSRDFIRDLEEMLDLIGFEKHFTVHYRKRYKKTFFTGILKMEDVEQFYTRWWEVTRRSKDRPPFSAPVYEKMKRERPQTLESIVDFLNKIVSEENIVFKKTGIRSKFLVFDLFKGNIEDSERELIEDLVKLDILNLEEIKIKKKDKEFSIEQSSSGESHLIISLLGLYSRVKPGSLILIDEPEISLHPNWQMRYIHFLKQMFRKYPGCHFIIASHSHFIVSDLEGASSSVVSLSRDSKTNDIVAELLEGKNTYGWSAEEVLYNVFQVKTTRNLYVEAELRELLHKIANKSNEIIRMKEIVNNLKTLKLSSIDPMNLIIKKAEEYLLK